MKLRSFRSVAAAVWAAALLVFFGPPSATAGEKTKSGAPCIDHFTRADGVLLADTNGRVLYGRNLNRPYVPASTLKVLTALSALEHLGPGYRYHTDIYVDENDNITIKGTGDPMLVSEIWGRIADAVSRRIQHYHDLILDISDFDGGIAIPGRSGSTNPYDAPPGALCANFNTVIFCRNSQGEILSGEPQTPMVAFAAEKINEMELEQGRHTVFHNAADAARYAGHLLAWLLELRGVDRNGEIRIGTAGKGNTLLLRFVSPFSLETVVARMLEFSSNFIANQLLLTVGARTYGSPATLEKGVRATRTMAARRLGLPDLQIVEGSGLSRKNRLTPLQMKAVLRGFLPYRRLLQQQGRVRYKTGSLRGIRARAGYVEAADAPLYYMVIFLNRDPLRADRLMTCLAGWAEGSQPESR